MSVVSTSPVGSPTTSGTGTLTVTGLVSGLDTNQIIQGLTAIDQQKITEIDQQKTAITTEQAAFAEIKTRLLTLQGNMTALSRSQNGLFDARTATVSDPTALAAAASSGAAAGVYHMRVASLAKAHQIAAQGFDAPTSSITDGTLTLTIGDVATQITVDGSNDTLQGLADAINSSGAAVTASIINDGSGTGRQAYRLVLAADETGTSNRIAVTNNLAASAGSATRPIFDAGSVGNAVAAANAGTAAMQANAGTGYTGVANNTYTFTVVTGGTVGTDDNLQLAYTDATGTNTGTITINRGDVNNPLTVAQGVSIQLSAGTLVAGDKFAVKTFVPTLQDAADAAITLGSGDGALTITNPTNQFDSLIPGVALNLLSSDPTKDLTLTVANDTDQMKKGIQDFVDSYNDLMTFIDSQTAYSADTSTAGVLLGNRQAYAIQDQLRSVVTNVVSGANPRLNNFSALGITTDDNAHLAIDDAKLSQVLAGGVAGVSLDDVHKLFALTGSSSNAGVEFVTSSAKTRASATPYGVQISQAAAKATVSSTNAIAAQTIIGSANNTFNVSLDGLASSALTLPPGTYSQLALAQALQAAINGDATLFGRRVTVGVADNKLTFTSERFGSASQFAMTSGTALADLGFVGGEAAQGRDVVGSYLVNGVAETAKGTGQFLVGDSDNANTADLQFRVALSDAQVGAGVQADIGVSRGVASQLDSLLTNYFDPIDGRLKALDDDYQQSLAELDRQRAKQTDLMQTKQQSLLDEFNAMEQTLSKLQSVGNYLTTQSASLQKTA